MTDAEVSSKRLLVGTSGEAKGVPRVGTARVVKSWEDTEC